jgi:hypothetical protein
VSTQWWNSRSPVKAMDMPYSTHAALTWGDRSAGIGNGRGVRRERKRNEYWIEEKRKNER